MIIVSTKTKKLNFNLKFVENPYLISYNLRTNLLQIYIPPSTTLSLIVINDKIMKNCANIASIYTLSEFVQNTKTNSLSNRDMHQLENI